MNATSSLSAGEPAAPPTIVLIEDDEVIAELIAELLEENGASVHVAHNAKWGLLLAADHRPHLIITDLHMAGLSGMDVLQATKRVEALQGTPVMIITADQRSEMRDNCVALGARTYLTKPFEGDHLLFHVRDALRNTA
jgi:DNA-binding response OmpR family regulator